MAVVQINVKTEPTVTMILSLAEAQSLAELLISANDNPNTIGKYWGNMKRALTNKGFRFHYTGNGSREIQRIQAAEIYCDPQSLTQLHTITEELKQRICQPVAP